MESGERELRSEIVGRKWEEWVGMIEGKEREWVEIGGEMRERERGED